MPYTAIYIPEFPTLAWLRADPAARASAAAVIEGTPPLERIVSFNRAAATLGVQHGMSKVQADTSGQIAFHPRSLSEEQAAFDLVFTAAERFTPRVQVIASPINGYAQAKQLAAILLLDRSGTERLFGSPRDYATRLRQALRALDFPANTASAPNAEASILLARSYSGVTSVEQHEVRAKLARLPVSSLRASDAIQATLSRWGIGTLGELAALPEEALISRIGQQGKRLLRFALGTEDHLLVPEEPAFLLNDQVTLDAPLESLESLLFLISPMLERILRRATSHAYALRSVHVRLTLERSEPHEVEVRPAIPVESRDLLLKLLNLKLQAEPPQAGIVGATLTAEPAIPQVAQRGLFQAQFPEPDKLDLLLALLNSLAGQGNAGSPFLVDSHREDEFSIGPFTPCAGRQITPPLAVRVALRRLRPLQPAKVVIRGKTPSLLFWKGERMELREATGPWQASGYWWDGRRWETEEWDVVTASADKPPSQNTHILHTVTKSSQPHGLVLRLLYQPAIASWFVAGLYD
jgi:protein ImuB